MEKKKTHKIEEEGEQDPEDLPLLNTKTKQKFEGGEEERKVIVTVCRCRCRRS